MKSLAIVKTIIIQARLQGKRERVIDSATSTRFMEFERLTH